MTKKCANNKEHTEMPNGYVNWHTWMGEMRKTHNQTRCPDCKLWVIWKMKNGKALEADQ